MGTAMRTKALQDARSVGAASKALPRTIHIGEGDLDSALDRLEVHAVQAVGNSVHWFDFDATGGVEPTEDGLLVAASSQLGMGIGTTLLSAEAAVEPPRRLDRLESAVVAFEDTAQVLEADDAGPALVHGFGTSPDDSPLGVIDTASAALDEMAVAAADVATAVLDKIAIVERVPAPLRDVGPAAQDKPVEEGWIHDFSQQAVDHFDSMLTIRLYDMDRWKASGEWLKALSGRGSDPSWAQIDDAVSDNLTAAWRLRLVDGAKLDKLADAVTMRWAALRRERGK